MGTYSLLLVLLLLLLRVIKSLGSQLLHSKNAIIIIMFGKVTVYNRV